MTKRQGLLLALVLASGSTLLTYIWYGGRSAAPAAATMSHGPKASAKSVSITAASQPTTAAGYAVPRYQRAVAIQVDTSRGAGPLVQASDRVDILLAARNPGDHRLADTIMQDVPVLGLSPAGGAEGGPGEGKRQVVVSVSPHDAQRLMVAQLKGSLLMTLRNPTDHEYAFVRPVVGPPPPRPPAVPAAPVMVATAPAPRPAPVRPARRFTSRPSLATVGVPPEPIPALSFLAPPEPAPAVRQISIPPPPAAPPPKVVEVVKGTVVQTIPVKE